MTSDYVRGENPMGKVAELVSVAGTYAEDGALYTAAARLQSAAALVHAHARYCDPALADCNYVQTGGACECPTCWQQAEGGR